MAIRIDPEQNERFALRLIDARFAGARVLEIGCGDGRLTRLIAEEARSVVAIDSDAAAVAELRRGSPSNVEALPCEFESFQAGTGRFDAVVFAWSL
jgi:2-polyprenyl-3-methyl-5-hydroxy-6-metoxy-1,4-benzoquinol methylase